MTMGSVTFDTAAFTTEALVRAMAPVETVLLALERECDGYIYSFERQELFATKIHSLWKNEFGPSKRYLRNLIRRYIHALDAHEVEPEADSLLELVIKCSQASDTVPDAAETGYKSFDVLHDTDLHLRIYPHHNDIALRLWEAAGVLAEYLLEHPDLVKGKAVIETGAGVGLTGLVLARCCHVKSIRLTDYTDLCLDNLKHNIAINWSGPPEVITHGFLDWNFYARDDCRELLSADDTFSYFKEADVLLAADVVYDIDAVPALAATVLRFLHWGGRAIFATTLRNRKTFDFFEGELKVLGIHCEYEDSVAISNLPTIFPIYHIQPKSDVRICTMTLLENTVESR